MSPAERIAHLHGLNLKDRQREAHRTALLSEAVAFSIIFAIVALAYFALKHGVAS